jgi:hypothetical protein
VFLHSLNGTAQLMNKEASATHFYRGFLRKAGVLRNAGLAVASVMIS